MQTYKVFEKFQRKKREGEQIAKKSEDIDLSKATEEQNEKKSEFGEGYKF